MESSDVGGVWEFFDDLHLVWVNVDVLSIDDIAQKLLGEFTLLIHCDTCFSHALEHFPEAPVVCHLVGCMDKDVIHMAYITCKSTLLLLWSWPYEVEKLNHVNHGYAEQAFSNQ